MSSEIASTPSEHPSLQQTDPNNTDFDENNKCVEMVANIDRFKELMHKMQLTRRAIVKLLLNGRLPDDEHIASLRQTYECLREMTTVPDDGSDRVYHLTITTAPDAGDGTLNKREHCDPFHINVRDEVHGLQKDVTFLHKLRMIWSTKTQAGENEASADPLANMMDCICRTNLKEILAPYHPISSAAFYTELEECKIFLKKFVDSENTQGRKPILITDWDGTMKDYCTQYATNLQPIYSAISLANFAHHYTRLAAVLTAGPLHGPGILDLTALPIDRDGPVLFSGSWGREWWIGGKRRVHADGISEAGMNALDRLSEEMQEFLSSSREFSQFGLVGSGIQRKVDRITLGVQTVTRDITEDLSTRYQKEVEERVHRVDPDRKILHFDSSQDLEVEVVVQSEGVVWNKANGVRRVVETRGDTLAPPGFVLICGDTHSDLPMLFQALEHNRDGVMSCFVTMDEGLRERVRKALPDPDRVCFVSCPDVIHAAIMDLFKEKLQKQIEQNEADNNVSTASANANNSPPNNSDKTIN